MLSPGIKYSMRKVLDDLRTLDLRARLIAARGGQKRTFASLTKQFAELTRVEDENVQDFLTSMWDIYDAHLRASLLPRPPFGFQKNQAIAGSMVFNPDPEITRAQLSFLEGVLRSVDLPAALLEDPAGHPPLFRSSKYLTSPNTIHHMYHIARFIKATNRDISDFTRIIEWGGGYGNMGKLFRRIGFKGTYSIIDLRLLSSLQWLYLSTIFGPAEVTLTTNGGDATRAHFELIPLGTARKLQLEADLFISTWALSESSPAAQDWVADTNSWFGAGSLLLAYQESSEILPAAGRIEGKAQQAGAIIEAIDLQPGNFYAFR